MVKCANQSQVEIFIFLLPVCAYKFLYVKLENKDFSQTTSGIWYHLSHCIGYKCLFLKFDFEMVFLS